MSSAVGVQQTRGYQSDVVMQPGNGTLNNVDYSLVCTWDRSIQSPNWLVPYDNQTAQTVDIEVPMVTYNTSLQISKIKPQQFRALARDAQDFLQENLERLGAQENESGFVRINIPMSAALKQEFEEIGKLRVNYWSPDAGLAILPESLHTHPQYFESYIDSINSLYLMFFSD